MKLHIWNRKIYATYEDAKMHGALYECEAPADLDEVRRYGFSSGVLADAMETVETALRCLNVESRFGAVITKKGKTIVEY